MAANRQPPDFERLDDARPERNKRSFFDWLRGKEEADEETDEEKLRRTLDEQLKQAARQRAEQFEEEQRLEEQRDEAETRKLKKRWRKKLFERSKQRLEAAATRGDEPTSGLEIAELMVAERIVKLHTILETEDLRRSEIKALKIHIDFMGLLSEKLSRPELEVPAEVEALYQTIAASVEEVDAGRPTITTQHTPETTTTPDGDGGYQDLAVSIVHAMHRVIKPQSAPAIPVTAPPQQPDATERSNRKNVTETLMASVTAAAAPAEMIRREIFKTTTVRRLAEVVAKAETTTIAQLSSTVDRPGAPSLPTTLPETRTAPAAEGNKNHSNQAARSQEDTLTSQLPDKPLEFWSDVDLLKKAEHVSLGNGRYLAEAYRRGEINREDLVKVLKSFDKGRDYRSEFLTKRETWRRHKESSLEYLPRSTADNTPQPSTSTPDADRPALKRQPVHAVKKMASHIRNIGRVAPSIPAAIKQDTRRFAKDARERLRRQGQFTLLLASVFLVLIVFGVVMTIAGH